MVHQDIGLLVRTFYICNNMYSVLARLCNQFRLRSDRQNIYIEQVSVLTSAPTVIEKAFFPGFVFPYEYIQNTFDQSKSNLGSLVKPTSTGNDI